MMLGFELTQGIETKQYFYVRNLQGDIIAVLDSNGIIVAEYEYGAWGKILSAEGPLAGINPIRYRGYYYDVETGYYYCQSRYYNPVWCRWISADVLMDTGKGILGTNMYAYCNNDPVNYYDTSGMANNDIHDGRRKNGPPHPYGTYTWSLEVFNALKIPEGDALRYADIFATANASVDDPLTSSGYWNIVNPSIQGLHFDTNLLPWMDSRESNYKRSVKNAEAFAAAGNIDGVLAELGKGLHSLQDQVYHNGLKGDISLGKVAGYVAGPAGMLIYLGPLGPIANIHGQGGKGVDTNTDAKMLGAYVATMRVLADFVRICNEYPKLPSFKIPM